MDPWMDAAHRGVTALAERGEEMGQAAGPIQAKGLQESPEGAVHLSSGGGGGAAMPDEVRGKMEAAFGADFSSVRIHEGPHAAALGALAYTQGTEIHFAPGQYQPGSQHGQELLGHELTHVVQQSQGRVQATTQASGMDINADASLEREADTMGARAARGEHLTGASAGAGTIQRRPAPGRTGAAHALQARTLESLAHPRDASATGEAPIQMSSIRDFANASNAAHDPGRLSEAVIRQTDEFQTLVRDYCHPPWIYTESDAVMACRLAIRTLRQGGAVDVVTQGGDLMHRAREQAAAAGGAEGQVNSLQWVPFSSQQAAADPAGLQSEFARWLLVAQTAAPSSTSGQMNCWELVMYGAYRAGVINEARLRAIYVRAVENVRNGTYASVGQTFEEATRASSPVTYREGAPDTPRPIRGDIVVFRSAPVHACIATGNVVRNSTTGAQECEVISLWTPNGRRVERTTIEALARSTPDRPILFWSARWD
jgi:hypothetical protein